MSRRRRRELDIPEPVEVWRARDPRPHLAQEMADARRVELAGELVRPLFPHLQKRLVGRLV